MFVFVFRSSHRRVTTCLLPPQLSFSESVEDVQSLPPSMVAGPSSPRPIPVPVEVRERERLQPVDILAKAAVALRRMAELLDTDDGSGEVAISDESMEDTLVCSNLAVGWCLLIVL